MWVVLKQAFPATRFNQLVYRCVRNVSILFLLMNRRVACGNADGDFAGVVAGRGKPHC
jgi:hypothetical protein